MKIKIFSFGLLFIIWLYFIGFGYWVWFSYHFELTLSSETSSVSNSPNEEQITENNLSETEPIPIPNIVSHQIMQQVLNNLNLKTLEKSISWKVGYFSPYNEAPNISYFYIEPAKFQFLFLRMIAPYLNFLNLKISFKYYLNHRFVSVRLMEQDNEDNFVIKNFHLLDRQTLVSSTSASD